MSSVIIKELNISEYRGIRKLVKPLELSSFNVLISRNNVGKTAILEALYLLTMPYSAYSEPPYGKKIIDFIAGMHGGLSSLIYGYAGTAALWYSLRGGIKIEFTGVHGITTKELRVESIKIDITRDGIKRVVLNDKEARDSDYRELLKALGIDTERGVLGVYIPNNSKAYEMIDSFVLKDSVWSWIEKEGLHKKVVKNILAPAIYDKFTEVTIKRDKLCVRKEVSEDIGPLYIDVDSLGEGVRRVLLTYLVVEYLRPKLLLWDDLEVAAHPSLLEFTLKWLAESRRQVVVSTHSIDVLYLLTQVRPKDCRVIVLRKSSDDIVSYKTLELDELEDYLGSGVDVRKIIEEFEL